jgi:hypothetical protein
VGWLSIFACPPSAPSEANTIAGFSRQVSGFGIAPIWGSRLNDEAQTLNTVLTLPAIPDQKRPVGRSRVKWFIIWPLPPPGRSAAVEASINGPVSQQELVRLATKLREDLMNYEEKLGSSREFAEIMNSAGALIVAITEPEEFRHSASQTQKARDGSSRSSLPHLAK